MRYACTVITHESLALDTSDPQVVRVNYVQLDDGIDMGGKLVFDRANLGYVIKEVQAASGYTYEKTEAQVGPDHFRIYQSGSDQQPIVNVLVRREKSLPHGGLTGVMMTIPYAKKLVELLTGIEGN